MIHTRTLQIAGFFIRLESELPVYLDDGHSPFEIDGTECKPNVQIVCRPELTEVQSGQEALLFEASDDKGPLYKIYRHSEGLAFCLYDQSCEQPGHRDKQQILVMDDRCTQGVLYMHPRSDGQMDALKYPLSPLLLYYLCVRNQAVLIHASGVFGNNRGRLFTGFSGTGKSTMAGLWHSAGHQIINDDRLVLRKNGEGYIMYNTPMSYQDKPKSAPLHAIHQIRHASENVVERLSGAKAVSNVMAFCIQNNYDASMIANNAGFISDLTGSIPVYRTGFVPEASVVDFIETHEC